MILLKVSDAKRVEYVALKEHEADILKHGLVVYKHCVTHIDKTSWLPIPEYLGRAKVKFGDITLEFMNTPSSVINALDRVGAFERQDLYKFIDRLIKRKTTMEHLRLIYEYIRHNETKENSLYLKALKKSCDHLVW